MYTYCIHFKNMNLIKHSKLMDYEWQSLFPLAEKKPLKKAINFLIFSWSKKNICRYVFNTFFEKKASSIFSLFC